MEIKDMEKYFSFEVLRKGYDYCKKGKVKELRKIKNGFSAKVLGKEQYKVIVDITKEPFEMKCTCPFSEKGKCKHMAAVLYCLKSGTLINENSTIKINFNEITDYEKYEKCFKQEYYKLFHNRNYIHENELEDYIELIVTFANETSKCINVNKELAYEIFENLLINVDGLDVYDQYNEKEALFETLFESFKELFNDARIFVRFLAFIGTIYTMNVEEFYFEHKNYILDLLYYYVDSKWQAEEFISLLKKLDNDKYAYDFEKRDFRIKIIYLNYYFIDKEIALDFAHSNLDIPEVCDFLLENKNDLDEQIELLKKMIFMNSGHRNERYYKKLLTIYEKNNRDKYIELLKEYFKEQGNIDIYRKIKKCYSEKEWYRRRKEYLSISKDSKLYRDICVEEGFYYDLLESLKTKWIETVNEYLSILVQKKPKEILELYSDKLMEEMELSTCRQHYQNMLVNFQNLLTIPEGKEELKRIIDYARENYQNRKALQEELDFFEETYM